MFGRKLRRIDEAHPELVESALDEEPTYSLEDLGNAYAQVATEGANPSPRSSDRVAPNVGLFHHSDEEDNLLQAPEVAESDGLAVTTDSVLESVLFLGNADNRPIDLDKILSLFRNVTHAELDECIGRLNAKYREQDRAFEIVRERGGFRMQLTPEMEVVRERFYGKAKETQLTQASIDCLALVAYKPGIPRDEIERLWGQPPNATLNLLIRKGLIRVEKKDKQSCYYTTERFLEVIGLESIDDLPREEA